MPLTLLDLDRAFRQSWGVDVCDDPRDVPLWSVDNPSRGQCGATALVVNDLLGGQLCVAPVHLPDGTQQGWHNWNLLPGGLELDLTREQFLPHERVGEHRVVDRPPGPPARGAAEYALLRTRVLAALA